MIFDTFETQIRFRSVSFEVMCFLVPSPPQLSRATAFIGVALPR
jgi:hypothetical protein